MLANDHAFVDFGGGLDKELAAFLQVEHGVAGHLAGAIRDQRTGGAHRNVALPLDVAVEQRVHNGGTARVGEHLAAQANQAARRNQELEAGAAGAVIHHLFHLRLADAQLFDHHADVLLGDIDGEHFEGLHRLAVDLAGNNLRAADSELEAFAAHHFDQDGELQFAAAHHLKGIGTTRIFDANGDVGEQLFVETIAQVTRSDQMPFAAGERRIVDGERHRNGGFINLDLGQRRWVRRTGYRLADRDAIHPGQRQHMARPGLCLFHSFEAFKRKHLRDLGLLYVAIQLTDGDFVAQFERAVEDAANG